MPDPQRRLHTNILAHAIFFSLIIYFAEFPTLGYANSLSSSRSTREFSNVFEDYDAQEPVNLLVCEGLVANLTCPSDRHISVQLANFGRFSLQPCNPTKATDINTQCYNDRTTELLKQRCDGKRECLVRTEINFFGDFDSCPNTYKYLDASYICKRNAHEPIFRNTREPVTISTPIISPTLTVKNTTATFEKSNIKASTRIDNFHRHAHCTSRFTRLLRWPETQGGHLSKLACPTGSDGHAEWMCSLAGTWTPESGPDLSRCTSENLRRLKAELEVDDELDFHIAASTLFQELNDFISKEMLVGGDLLTIVYILERIIQISMTKTTPTNLHFSEEIFRTLGYLLSDRQYNMWNDVSEYDRRRLAEKILNIFSNISSNVASQNFEKDTIIFTADHNIFMQIETKSTASFTMPSLVNITNDIVHFKNDESPQDCHDCHVIAMYTNYNQTLNKYLSFVPSTDYFLNSESSDLDKKINSRKREILSNIISVKLNSKGSKRLETENTAEKYSTFINLFIANKYNTRRDDEKTILNCVRWRRGWTTSDCTLSNLNETYAICKCDLMVSKSEYFALIIDTFPQEQAEEEKNTFFQLFKEILLSSNGMIASCIFALFSGALAFICLNVFVVGETSMQLRARKNLCIVICCFEITLLFGFIAPSTNIYNTCEWLKIGLRFFTLTLFSWNLIDAFTIYLATRTNQRNICAMCFNIFGYGIPLFLCVIPTIFGTAASSDMMDKGIYCWNNRLIGDKNFIGFLLAPGAAFLTLTAITLMYCFVKSCCYDHRSSIYLSCKQQQQRPQNLYFPEMQIFKKPPICAIQSYSTSTSLRWTIKSTALVHILLAFCFCIAILWNFSTVADNSLIYAISFAIFNCVLSGTILFLFVIFDETVQRSYEKWSITQEKTLLHQLYQRLSHTSFFSTNINSSISSSLKDTDECRNTKGTTCVIDGSGQSLTLRGAEANISMPTKHFKRCLGSTSTNYNYNTHCCVPLTSSDSSDCTNCTMPTTEQQNRQVFCSNGAGNKINDFFNNINERNLICNASPISSAHLTPMSTRIHGQNAGEIINGNQFCSLTCLHPANRSCCCIDKHNNQNNQYNNYGNTCYGEQGFYDYASIAYNDFATMMKKSVTDKVVHHHLSPSPQSQSKPICVETPRVPQLYPQESTSHNIVDNVMKNVVHSSPAVVRFRGNHPPPKFPPPPPPPLAQDDSSMQLHNKIPENLFAQMKSFPSYQQENDSLNGPVQNHIPPSSSPPSSASCTSARSATLLLRMDLSRNEPLFAETLHKEGAS